MLVLTRKVEEKILINDCIEITICKIKESSVQIGIKAPKEMLITRPEKLKPQPLMATTSKDND